MLVQASQLMGRMIGAMDIQATIGTTKRLIIDPATGQIIALGVQPNGWFRPEQFLVTRDIIDLEPGVIVIKQEDDLLPLTDLVRVADVVKQKLPILNQKARTESGQSLGVVDDLLIELESWRIAKYYLKRLMNERIIPASDVHSITRQAVIFFDRINEGEPLAPQVEAIEA